MRKMAMLSGILAVMAIQANAAELSDFLLPANAKGIKVVTATVPLSIPIPKAVETAAMPTPAELNNQPDPKDPYIKLGMFENLQKAGIKTPLTDVRELVKPGAEETLLKLGFQPEPRADGIKVYTLGHAQLYSDGQRAVFNKDGSVNLVSFSQPGGGHPIMEIIGLDAAGNIFNRVQMLP